MNGRGGKVDIVDYDLDWPQQFAQLAARIQNILGPLLLSVEHVGSTAVSGPAAKPVIDINLVVANSREEHAYAPKLQDAGFALTVREPNWFEHRMFEHQAPRANLHVFSSGCPEIERMRLFRDWLCHSSEDRALYARVKRNLAIQNWTHIQDYADAKQAVIAQIMTRASAWVTAR